MTPSVILLLTLFTYANGVYNRDDWVSQMIAKRTQVRFCGQALDDALKLVCNGSFNSIFEDKRSTSLNKFRAALKFGHYPYNQISRSLSIFPVEFRRRKRQSGGVVSECCKKTCTFNELTGYCSGR